MPNHDLSSDDVTPDEFFKIQNRVVEVAQQEQSLALWKDALVASPELRQEQYVDSALQASSFEFDKDAARALDCCEATFSNFRRATRKRQDRSLAKRFHAQFARPHGIRQPSFDDWFADADMALMRDLQSRLSLQSPYPLDREVYEWCRSLDRDKRLLAAWRAQKTSVMADCLETAQRHVAAQCGLLKYELCRDVRPMCTDVAALFVDWGPLYRHAEYIAGTAGNGHV